MQVFIFLLSPLSTLPPAHKPFPRREFTVGGSLPVFLFGLPSDQGLGKYVLPRERAGVQHHCFPVSHWTQGWTRETYVCLGELFQSAGRKETYKILKQKTKKGTKWRMLLLHVRSVNELGDAGYSEFLNIWDNCFPNENSQCYQKLDLNQWQEPFKDFNHKQSEWMMGWFK